MSIPVGRGGEDMDPVVLIVGWRSRVVVSRLHRVRFAGPQRRRLVRASRIVQFNPKVMVYEVYAQRAAAPRSVLRPGCERALGQRDPAVVSITLSTTFADGQRQTSWPDRW